LQTVYAIKGGTCIGQRGKLSDIFLNIGSACKVASPIMARVKPIVWEKVCIISWPFKLLFFLRFLNCIKVFNHCAVLKLKPSPVVSGMNNFEIGFNEKVEFFCILVSKISTNSKKDMICHKVLAIFIYTFNKLLQVLLCFL